MSTKSPSDIVKILFKQVQQPTAAIGQFTQDLFKLCMAPLYICGAMLCLSFVGVALYVTFYLRSDFKEDMINALSIESAITPQEHNNNKLVAMALEQEQAMLQEQFGSHAAADIMAVKVFTRNHKLSFNERLACDDLMHTAKARANNPNKLMLIRADNYFHHEDLPCIYHTEDIIQDDQALLAVAQAASDAVLTAEARNNSNSLSSSNHGITGNTGNNSRSSTTAQPSTIASTATTRHPKELPPETLAQQTPAPAPTTQSQPQA